MKPLPAYDRWLRDPGHMADDTCPTCDDDMADCGTVERQRRRHERAEASTLPQHTHIVPNEWTQTFDAYELAALHTHTVAIAGELIESMVRQHTGAAHA